MCVCVSIVSMCLCVCVCVSEYVCVPLDGFRSRGSALVALIPAHEYKE